MEKQDDLIVITKTRKLIEYIFTVTEKSPKKFRYSLIVRLQNLSLDILENLLRANEVFIDTKKRIEKREAYNSRVRCQKEAIISMKFLGYLSMIPKSV